MMEGLAAVKDVADELNVYLVTTETTEGADKLQKQFEFLLKAKQGAACGGH